VPTVRDFLDPHSRAWNYHGEAWAHAGAPLETDRGATPLRTPAVAAPATHSR